MKFKLTKKVRILDTEGQATVIGFRPDKYILRLPSGEIRHRQEDEVTAWQTRQLEMADNRQQHEENQWEARDGR